MSSANRDLPLFLCSHIFHEAIFNILLHRKIARYFLIKVDHKCKHIVNKTSLRIIKILTFFSGGGAEAGYLRSMDFSRLSFFLMNIIRCSENHAC